MLLLITTFWAKAQEEQKIYKLSDVEITGNKWTKEQVILREMNFQEGVSTSLENFESKKLETTERLKSLGVFNDVELEYVVSPESPEELVCRIKVVENWYIYPGVIFELADRNFSEWWFNQGRDLSRTNYGVRLSHINATGRNDKLVAQIQSGFKKKYELVYNLPYLNREGTWGAEAFVFFANQDELPYLTRENRTIFGGYEDRILLSRFRAGSALFYRPTIYQHHSFRLEFHQNYVDPIVIQELNPDYFLESRNQIRFFYFNYHFTYDRRISQFYPIGGYQFVFDFKKEGFGIYNEYNNTQVYVDGEYYHTLAPRLVLGLGLKVKANLDRSTVSFANNTALGYGSDILGGYYRYVIDGTDYIYLKNNLRYKAFQRKFDLKWFPLRQFRVLNVEMHGRLFADVGYVNERTYRQLYDNDFSNRWLYGVGPAVDILLFNNYMLSFNLGFNHLGERDYFFQYRTNF